MARLEKGTYLGNAIGRSRADGITAWTSTFGSDAPDAPTHYHESSHLSFVLQGGIVDKRKTAESERSSGELLFFHAGEIHQSTIGAFPTKNITLEIEHQFLLDNLVAEAAIQLAADRNPNAKFIMLKIYKELMTADAFSDCSIKMLLIDLIHTDPKAASHNPRPRWINIVAELTRDKWNESLSLKDLSKAANIHPVTISKHFPRYFSCTFGEHMRRLKVEKSLQFLGVPSFSLTEIAAECGFSDQSHFIRTFKQLTGFLPNIYKKL